VDGDGRTRARPARKAGDHSIGPIKFGVLAGGDETVPDTAIADYGIAELGKKHERRSFSRSGSINRTCLECAEESTTTCIRWNPSSCRRRSPAISTISRRRREDGEGIRRSCARRRKRALEGAVQAYLAAISYLDAQVGRVLDALEKSEFRENTIICFWGDHGWHLGEKEHWRKFALWEGRRARRSSGWCRVSRSRAVFARVRWIS
jgi:hypothetical protein